MENKQYVLTEADIAPETLSILRETTTPLPEDERLQLLKEYAGWDEDDLRAMNLLDVDKSKLAESYAAGVRIAIDYQRMQLYMDTYVTKTVAATLMQESSSEVSYEHIDVLRKLGYLVSVSVSNEDLYPLFQFDDTGMPHTAVHIVNDELSKKGGSNWSILSWWWTPSSNLDGACPGGWLKLGKPEGRIVASLLDNASPEV